MKKHFDLMAMAVGSVWSAVSWQTVGAVLITIGPALVTMGYGLVKIYYKIKRERERDNRDRY